MVFTVPRDGEIFIDQVIERCKNLISSGIWEGLSPVRLDTWMKNFTSGQERYFGACVLDSLIYRSEKQTVALMEQLFQGTLPDFIRREPPPGNPTAPVYAKKLTQDEADKLVDDAYMAFYIVQTIAPIYLEPSNSVFPYYGRPRDEDYWLRLFFVGRQQKWPATMMDVIIPRARQYLSESPLLYSSLSNLMEGKLQQMVRMEAPDHHRLIAIARKQLRAARIARAICRLYGAGEDLFGSH